MTTNKTEGAQGDSTDTAPEPNPYVALNNARNLPRESKPLRLSDLTAAMERLKVNKAPATRCPKCKQPTYVIRTSAWADNQDVCLDCLLNQEDSDGN
jgi:hypothetical protein